MLISVTPIAESVIVAEWYSVDVATYRQGKLRNKFLLEIQIKVIECHRLINVSYWLKSGARELAAGVRLARRGEIGWGDFGWGDLTAPCCAVLCSAAN